VYSKLDTLSLFNLPCAGFCETSELLTVPRILIGNRQLLPGATPMSPVEFSPQSARVIDVEHSEAARTKDTGSRPVTSAMSAKTTNLYNHVVNLLVFMENPLTIIVGVRAYAHCPGQSASPRRFLNPATAFSFRRHELRRRTAHVTRRARHERGRPALCINGNSAREQKQRYEDHGGQQGRKQKGERAQLKPFPHAALRT
jgi:hypothetical protein